MKKLEKRILAVLLTVAMVASLTACGKDKNPENQTPAGNNQQGTTQQGTTQQGNSEASSGTTAKSLVDLYGDVETTADLVKKLSQAEFGTDWTELYEKYGKQITIADVTEDPETGFAYITVDGKTYELGMDFLSMAMVYNTSVPEGGRWKTEDDVYAEWWKLYIQRWNYLLPEIPLYSNEYYDFYNAQIKGVSEYPTNPFWSPTNALIDWSSDKADKSIIVGNTTDLSGKFRYAAFGATSPGAADNDVAGLVSGLATVESSKEGGYVWNSYVVKDHKEIDNADGSRTYDITIHNDLKFSDGSKVTAKNYLVSLLTFSSPVAAEAAGKDHKSGYSYVGYDTFAAYNGTNESATATKEFSGARLYDDYHFSVTVSADNLPYFYAVTYGAFGPEYLPMWIGNADIKDDGKGVYLTSEFYEKDADGSYKVAKIIKATAANTDQTYPYSGPYCVESYDAADKSAVLVRNKYYKGNYEGSVPKIEKVIYKKIISETQLDDFLAGGVDVLAGVTGGDDTNEAIAAADKSGGKFVYTHYSRAGYGKMGFRADYGAAQYTEVRQAIAYCMDRSKFAKDFTGGFGGVVDGPYYSGSWMNKAAIAQGMMLNAYATSLDSAIEVLEKGGWVFDKDGKEYKSGVRYKKIAGDLATENDINYKSLDGVYTTVKVGNDYYMPLVLNWYGTQNNEFTDLLVTGFMTNSNIQAAGFYICNTIGDFSPMLDELYQMQVYGYYSGTPMYAVFNFATGFNSAVYDYSYNWRIDPDWFDEYSICYCKDAADILWLK